MSEKSMEIWSDQTQLALSVLADEVLADEEKILEGARIMDALAKKLDELEGNPQRIHVAAWICESLWESVEDFCKPIVDRWRVESEKYLDRLHEAEMSAHEHPIKDNVEL